jgi:Uma2 family endonuclease
MTAVAHAGALPQEQRFTLDDVDWAFYESVLQRVGDRHIFVTYDRGRIEIMAPSWRHDESSRLIGLLIHIMGEEFGVALKGGGSTTFRREDLQRGLEADQCFYTRNLDRIRGRREIDLGVDPPPDLAVEVEITRRMLPRQSLYEAIGVPELWRYDGRELTICVLGPDRRYVVVEASPTFPHVRPQQMAAWVAAGEDLDDIAWARMVRQAIASGTRPAR